MEITRREKDLWNLRRGKSQWVINEGHWVLKCERIKLSPWLCWRLGYHEILVSTKCESFPFMTILGKQTWEKEIVRWDQKEVEEWKESYGIMFYSINNHLLNISSGSEAHLDKSYTSATKEMCSHAAFNPTLYWRNSQ